MEQPRPLILALVVISLLAALVAFLSGPSDTAVTVRRTVVGLSGDHLPQTAASVFIRRHTAAFRVGGVALAAFAMFTLPTPTFGWFLVIVVVLVGYEVSFNYVAPLDDDDPARPVPEPAPD